jgi:hypothetical protein
MNVDIDKQEMESESEADDEIWEGIASHLLTSDDIVPLDLVTGDGDDDDDLMPADLMTVDTLVKLDPNR